MKQFTIVHFGDSPPMTDSEALKAIEALRATARYDAIQQVGTAILQTLQGLGFEMPRRAPEFKADVLRKIPRKRPASAIRPGSDVAKVYDAIRRNPGKRGSELRDLLAVGATGVNERTMRTALRRLRVRGFIEQDEEGGAWFPTSRNE